MHPDVTPLIRKLVTQVPDLKLVIVFGSFADGSQRHGSDIDLAFAAARPLKNRALYDLTLDLQTGCDRRVDLVDLANADLSIILKYEIVTSGKVVFEADNCSVSEHHARIFRDYQDFRYRRADLEQDLSDRLKAYANA